MHPILYGMERYTCSSLDGCVRGTRTVQQLTVGARIYAFTAERANMLRSLVKQHFEHPTHMSAS